MAKLQAYKFVNPGVSSLKSPTVAAARKQTLALNRLGGTISSIGTVVSDIEKISIRQIKNDKLRERAERRRDRRELDQATEETLENKKAAKRKPKLTRSSLKIAKGGLSWVEKFLAPIGKFLSFIAKIAITKEILDWVSDPTNIDKLSDFLEKTHFVFSKLFGWAAGFTNNILDGFSALTDPNGTFIQRLGGVGTIMKGIIGLKYLMNPFSLITDILGLIDLLTGNKGNRRGGKNPKNPNKNRNKNKGPRNRPGRGGRNLITSSGGRSTGPLRGVREFFRIAGQFFGKKTDVTVSGKGGGNWFTDLFKRKANVTGGGSSNNWFNKLFKGKTKVSQGVGGTGFKGNVDPTKITQGMGGKSSNWFTNLFKPSQVTKGTGGVKTNFFKNLLGKFRITPGGVAKGVAGGLVYTAADITANAIVDQVINKPIGKLIDANLRKKVEERFLKDGSEKSREYYQNIINNESKKTPINQWVNMATLGYGSIFIGPKTQVIDKATQALGYLDQITSKENQKTNLESIFEKPKKKSNWFSNLFGGGDKKKTEKKTEGNWFTNLFSKKKPQQMFLGGLFKGVKKAVSGIWNGVSKIASNPIVGTALSFIPGMQIPMAVVNGINAAQSGDIMGAISAGLGGLGSFANINTVNAISQPQWLQNLRFSGFGQGVANMYHSGANAFSALSGGFNNFMGSKAGQIAGSVLSGDYMGALNTFNPKFGGIASNIMSGNYGGALSAFNPEMGAAVTKGMAMIDSFRQDPMGLISSIAEQQGMGGVLKAVTGLFGGGDKITAMTQIAAEMGIDPKVLGAVKSAHHQYLTEGGISAEYAMDQAMEFIPIPTIIEKIVPIPQAVAINTGGNTIVISAPNSLLERSK